ELVIDQYYQPVRRYLLGVLHDEDAAEEVLQQFALKLLRGDFARVDRNRGRFRDYLKTSLGNLVKNYQKRESTKKQRENPCEAEELKKRESKQKKKLSLLTADKETALKMIALIKGAKERLRMLEEKSGAPLFTVLELHEKEVPASKIAQQ